MTDVADERRSIPPATVARPKGATTSVETQNRMASELIEQRRPVGRPPKPDAFTTLRVIAVELEPLERSVRRQVLETLLALSE